MSLHTVFEILVALVLLPASNLFIDCHLSLMINVII
jgi:hypothetical protein